MRRLTADQARTFCTALEGDQMALLYTLSTWVASRSDGEELAAVSRSLGHSNMATKAEVYGHVTLAMLQRSAHRMDGILTSRRASTG